MAEGLSTQNGPPAFEAKEKNKYLLYVLVSRQSRMDEI